MRIPRLFGACAVVPALLLASGCVAVQEAAVDVMVRPFRLPSTTPPQELARRDVAFVGVDDVLLKGWLFDPPAGTPPRGLVVFLHGKDANRSHFVGAATRWVNRGWSVLTYDQRAHGRSGGRWCTYGAREEGDLARALDRFAGSRPVVLMGESMGAAVALQAAAVEPRVKGVVAAASFSDLRRILTERAPGFMSADDASAAIALAEARAQFRVDDIAPARAAAAIHVPVLLLHGEADHFIDPSHTDAIAAQLGPNARVQKLPGVAHEDVLRHDESWAAVEAWFDQHSPEW